MKTKNYSKLLLIFAMVLTLVATTSCKKCGCNAEVSIGMNVSLSGVNSNFTFNFNGNIQNVSLNLVWGIVRKSSTSAVQSGDVMYAAVEYCGTNQPIPVDTGNGWVLQNPLGTSGAFDGYTEGQQTFDLNNAFNPSWNGYTVVAVQVDLNQVSNAGQVRIIGVHTPNTLLLKEEEKAETK